MPEESRSARNQVFMVSMPQLYFNLKVCKVPDDIVVKLVKAKIAACEKECRHWVIEGFPRTKVQALSLEQLGVIPDKMILLKCSEEKTLAKMKQNLMDGKP